MKINLLVAIVLLSSCNYQSKDKRETVSAAACIHSLVTIDQEIDDCSSSITKYETLIDHTLGGDVEAMKRLPGIKKEIEIELDGLKRKSVNFDEKQGAKLEAAQKRFLIVDSRIQ